LVLEEAEKAAEEEVMRNSRADTRARIECTILVDCLKRKDGELPKNEGTQTRFAVGKRAYLQERVTDNGHGKDEGRDGIR